MRGFARQDAKAKRLLNQHDAPSDPTPNKNLPCMNWKSILFIAAIAIGAVYAWNKFVAPKVGISA